MFIAADRSCAVMNYTFESLPCGNVGYNAMFTASWEASGGDVWTVPLGLSIGRALDLMIDPYHNVARPDGAAGASLARPKRSADSA